MKSLITKFALTAICFGLLVGPLALAQTSDIGQVYLPGAVQKSSVSDLVDIMRGVVRWVYIIFFVIAILFILLAAFSYLFAAGDAEKVATAKNRLIYAAVAIAVALLAVGFENIIRVFLSSPSA